MRELLFDAAERAANYREAIGERSVAPSAQAIADLSHFDHALPEHTTEPSQVLAMLDQYGSPATYGMTGGRYFGFVIGGSLPATVASNWLTTAWDNNAGLFVGHPIGVKLEQIALKWMLDLLHLPPESAGAFVTGATVANFTALAAARHHVLEQVGWNVENDGLFGAPPINVVVGEEVHPSALKALSMLGLGRNRLTRVPVDDQGRMRADSLPTLTAPAIVILQAGNVNTGSFDPFEQVI